MQINLDMSPMAAPNFEAGRLGEKGIEILRLLERTLKETLCLDLESLCVIAGEKVWQIKVDVHVLDHDGSIIDCSSIAVICALKSFSLLSLNKVYPELAVGRLRNFYNLYKYFSSGISALLEIIEILYSRTRTVLKCVSMATQRAVHVDQLIKGVFAEDALHRSKKTKNGFWTLVRPYSVLYTKREKENFTVEIPISEEMIDAEVSTKVVYKAEQTNALLGKKKKMVDAGTIKKGRIVHTIKQSDTLMTQQQHISSEEEMTIVDEILRVRIDAEGGSDDPKNCLESEVKVIAVNKSAANKARRKKRLLKKNSDVHRLLIDLDNEDCK
uniref:Exoribonuclease phosphorolytic domain-containing protein n=1 Tax=Romanomermis culicivorax TaxID=13658 RepID=A0A915KE44_ROMCU